MTREDAERITGMLGRQLAKDDKWGWRDRKAVITFLAYEAGWQAASALADMWDLDEQTQEQIHRQVTR